MRPQPEFAQFFADKTRLAHVQQMQVSYWQQTLAGQVDEKYMQSRRQLGMAHAKVGLSLPTYFAGMNISLNIISEQLYDGFLSGSDYVAAVHSLAKIVHLETAVVVQAYAEITREKIEQQNRAMMEMSTPVTSIWQGILMLPIVGVLDSKRAQDLMHSVLAKIADTRAKVIILDISGVAVVDTAVANHIIKATKLMGCECTVSGVSPAIAQTIVELGIDVENISTNSTLRDALEQAMSMIGVSIVSQ